MFFRFWTFREEHELYSQVVAENSSTLYLTRPIGSPVISTDLQHAFILGIAEKHREVITQGLNFS